MTPRENIPKTLRCDNPEWIPVCLSLFPNQNPSRGIPDALKHLMDCTSGNLANDIVKVGEYLGAEDHMLPVDAPASLVSSTCAARHERTDSNRETTVLTTPGGELRQVRVFPEGAPSMVVERYVKSAEDAALLLEYFSSLKAEPNEAAKLKIRETRRLAGENGVLFLRTNGTPLGMCYRVYSDLTDLIYLLADEPALMGDLFACMEEKYFQLYERMLKESPEIDAFLGMDDTSTTLISPDMFEQHNVELTNKRADLCHMHGRLYLHHSCGLIKNLLPVYRKTRMDGIDAFTEPPIGDVTYSEGRRLLGPGYSFRAGLANGLAAQDLNTINNHVESRFREARAAGNVVFAVGGANLEFPALQAVFETASAMKHF